MSYILDALKQNEQNNAFVSGNTTMHEQYYETEKKLQRYRKLTLLLLFIIILMLGFFLGKYVQKNEIQQSNGIVNVNDKPVEPLQKAQPIVDQAHHVQPHNEQQSQQVLSPNNKTEPLQITLAQDNQKQLISNAEQVTNLKLAKQPAVTAQNTNQANQPELDLSQYRVVGEPLKTQKITESQPATELAQAFSQAFNEIEQQNQTGEVVSASKFSSQVTPINLLPSNIQAQIPSMIYQAHIHASEAQQSWIKINGKDLYQGDRLQGIQIIEIAAEQTVMRYQGYLFSLRAMDDWQY